MFEKTFKNIDDKLWKDAGCSSELDYVTPSALSGTSPKYDIKNLDVHQPSPIVFGGGRWGLDFIINYDVKYRMGASVEGDDEE